MNPDVKGHFIHNAIDNIIKNDISFFTKFSLIIYTQYKISILKPLANYCYIRNIPLITLFSYGLMGKTRLQIREHVIIESHPTNDRYDLYIHPLQLQYWPALQEYINSFQMEKDKMDGEEHAHVPYIVILAQEMKKWLQQVKLFSSMHMYM